MIVERPPRQPRAVRLMRLWQRILARREGLILLLGLGVAAAYFAAVLLTGLWSEDLHHRLLAMTGTHILGGRLAGMSLGYMHQLELWLNIVANMAIETFMVLIFYALFVLSYRRLAILGPLKEPMERASKAAQAHRRTVMRLGVPGLFLFVWFPFWMTGPLIGSVIGFLIGLRHHVNLLTVLGGTYVAILSWGVLLHNVYERVEHFASYVAPVIVIGALSLTLYLHIRWAVKK